MYLTEEQRKIGRRNFLKAMAALPAAAAFPFAFNKSHVNGEPLKVGFIGIGNEGRALLHNTDPDFVKIVAVADIYPPHLEVACRLAKSKFNPDFNRETDAFEDYRKMLADPRIEAVITACPLHMHHRIVMDALEAGKHVLCEKLMAYTIDQCKEMIAKAKEKNLVLQIGHQRHYAALYHQALEYVKAGQLGEIHHIRALWHRKTKWTGQMHKTPADIRQLFATAANEVNGSNTSQILPPDKAEQVKTALKITEAEAAELLKKVKGVDWNTAGNSDPAKYGYGDYEHFRNWRLYKKTSQGLMAELGSHQLDACGLILNHAHPISVVGMGHKVVKDPPDREAADHVYCMFEYPGEVTVTYSSITSNKFDNYGEIIYGTKGTMIIEGEKDVMLFEDGPNAKNTEIAVASAGPKGAVTDTSPSAPADAGAAKATGTSGGPVAGRGYKEEIQHFAICCRSNGMQKPRCDGVQALGDAVIALKANEAIESGARIKFDPEWFRA